MRNRLARSCFLRLFIVFFVCGAVVTSCGYRGLSAKDHSVIFLPPIKGDYEGLLYANLAESLASVGAFSNSLSHSDLELTVEVTDDPFREQEREIGFRFARNPFDKETKMLVPSERRQSLFTRITLKDTSTGKVVLGPKTLRAEVDYDFDSDLFDDKAVPVGGANVPLVRYSLGQLENHETARETARGELTRKLASKITSYITCVRPICLK